MTAMQFPLREWSAPRPLKITVELYDQLARNGAFDEVRGKVELLDGVIKVMSPQHRLHGRLKNEITFRLRDRLIELASNRSAMAEMTVSMPPRSAPDPDVIVTSEPDGEGFVPLETVSLAIEVSVTTLRYDLGPKKRIYARAGVPEYWVFDVRNAKVHQFWSPQGRDYENRDEAPVPGPLASKLMPELQIDTTGLL